MLYQFTNQYQLSKTLRFELKPVGSGGNRLLPDEATKVFAEILEKDRKIKEAYIALKPVLDGIHENIINASLISEEAQNISFSDYFEEYRKGKEKNLNTFENELRVTIGKTFEKTANEFAKNTGNSEDGKPIFKKKKDKDVGVEYLTQSGILKYIENNIQTFVAEDKVKEFIHRKKITERITDKNGKTKEKKKIESSGYLAELSSFFGYFTGYNQNRENYYATKDEKATAVATRIVHDNLPKYCDNALGFESRKNEYASALQYLKDNNRITQIKDAKTNTMIDAEAIGEEWFKIEKFSECLAQDGIENYNRIIGHYNLLINLYNQARKDEKEFKKLSQFKTLDKQIGCGTKKALFDELNSDDELKNTLESISNAGKKYFKQSTSEDKTTIYSFTKWLKQNEDWNGVYWSKTAVDKISNNYLANWHEIKDRIQGILQSKDKTQKELKDALKSVASYDKKREEQLKINDAVELSGLFAVLNQGMPTGWSKNFFKETVLEKYPFLIDESKPPSKNLINLLCADMENLAESFTKQSEQIVQIVDYKNEDNILTIKKWLDTVKSVLWLTKYFEVKESKVKGNSINPELTNMLTALLRAEDVDWFNLYDLVRNYLSKKPQDDAKKNKLKLNFGSGNLLNGFVDSHSDSDNATQYGGYLFRKKVNSQDSDFEYFIGISKDAKLFRCHLQNEIQEEDKSEFERLEYYQVKSTTYFDDNYSKNKINLIADIEASIDNLVANNGELKKIADKIKKRSGNNEITPTTLIDRINKEDSFKSVLQDEAIVSSVDQTILGLKRNIEKFIERNPQLEKIQNTAYSGVDGLKRIIDDLQNSSKENKVFNFFKVSQVEFERSCSNNDKPLYLFKISNKDLSFSETSRQKDKNGVQIRKFKGTENLHTLLFRGLMREFKSFDSLDLGSGEIFFREKAIDYTPQYDSDYKREKGHHYAELKDKFTYPIVSDRRFIMDKFQLHLSIALNFNPKKDDINQIVNDNFTQTEDIQFLGIDRGEKHLIYYSLVNAKGEIVEQNHLDLIGKKDYLQAINEAAKIRRQKQENWQQKGKISNLKDGYISLAVHEIVEKMKDKDGNFKPTYMVLEDLNTGFKRGRQKFEQQVYQKFELALAKKLNYLVDKNAKMGEFGSVSKALQFTPQVSNYQDIENRKQVGIMLYTRANYTSVTDPATGWRKTIYLKKGSEVDIKKQIIEIFDEIGVEGNDYFFQYKDKHGKEWKLWSSKYEKSLERYRAKRGKDKNEFIIESIDIKASLDGLFEKFDKKQSLKQQLENGVELTKADGHTAWESLRFAIDMIQQIRNSGDTKKSQDDNFLLSPVRNELGGHFDSRKSDDKLPKDADANGAYNIARKGIVMYEHIKQWVADGKAKDDLDLFISDLEWDMWLADKKSWQSKLKIFASKKAKTKEQKQ